MDEHVPPRLLGQLQVGVTGQTDVVKEGPVAGAKGLRVKCAEIAVTQDYFGLKNYVFIPCSENAFAVHVHVWDQRRITVRYSRHTYVSKYIHIDIN